MLCREWYTGIVRKYYSVATATVYKYVKRYAVQWDVEVHLGKWHLRTADRGCQQFLPVLRKLLPP